MVKRREALRPHPKRDAIIDALRNSKEPLSPNQLAKITNSTLGALAYHVRTLLAAGVIELADEKRRRGAIEHFYRLVDANQQPVGMGDPIETLVGLCRARTLRSANGGPPRLAVVDDAARDELGALLERMTKQVQKIVTTSTERANATNKS